MATLAGEQSIKGSSDTARLLLLTFVFIGITYVAAPRSAGPGAR